MGARQKLNRASLNGSLLIAAAVGLVTGSLGIFFVVFVVLAAASVYTGDIRPRFSETVTEDNRAAVFRVGVLPGHGWASEDGLRLVS